MECNYINVTFSATNITLNGSFEVTLLDFLPNPGSFPTITCNSIISGGASYELAKYNFPAKKFYISAPLPNVYKGRVNITSDHKIEISPVKFTDEGNSYKCTFTHYEGATPVLLSSNTAVIEHVYSKYPGGGGGTIYILGTGTCHREGYRFSRFWYKERYRIS